MGWTYTSKPHNVCDYFRKSFTWETDAAKNTCLKVCMVKRSVVYAAVECVVKATQERQVFAVVCPVRFTRAKDGYDFGYNDMSEDMGPNEADCPKAILDLLTPLPEPKDEKGTTHQYARDWRERCYANLKARKALKLTVGTKLTFVKPMSFANGCNPTVLYCKSTKPLRFVPEPGKGWETYRINRKNLVYDFKSGNLQLEHPPKERKYKVKDMKFSTRNTVVTINASRVMSENGMKEYDLFNRHYAGDWGLVCKEDAMQSDEGIKNKGMLHSVYETPITKEKIWVITDAGHEVTTILMPDDY